MRKIEHTLQQSRDKQTQTLPDSEWEQQALINVLGFNHYDDFLAKLNIAMEQIHGHFNELVEESHETHSEEDELFSACLDAWQLELQSDEFVDAFSDHLSRTEAMGIFNTLAEFKDTQRNYRMGQRGEDTLSKLLPEILYVLVIQHPNNSVQVLSRLLGVIEAITGRTTYLDLLLENPDVLKQLVKLCERSGWVAQEIKRFPFCLMNSSRRYIWGNKIPILLPASESMSKTSDKPCCALNKTMLSCSWMRGVSLNFVSS